MPIIVNRCHFCRTPLPPNWDWPIASDRGKHEVPACEECYNEISHWFWRREEFGG